MTRAATAKSSPVTSITAVYCLLVLLSYDLARATAPLESVVVRILPHRALLDDKHSISHRGLLSTSAGPGLRALPPAAYGSATHGSANLGFMSATAALQQASTASDSKAGCPSTGRFLSTATDTRSSRIQIPVCVTSDSRAVLLGATAATTDSRGSVGTVYFLNEDSSCNFRHRTPLPNPLPLLPINYELRLDTAATAAGALVSHLAASTAARAVLAATAHPAVFRPPNNLIVQESATALPYILTVMSYKRISKANTTRYSYMPAGILPIPAMAAGVDAEVTGLAISDDGRTALACLMPRCANANLTLCGSGAAHVFRLATDTAATTESVGGHQWMLVATLPFAGYGTPNGHAISCSLSRDGSTAAILAAAAVTESVQVPVASIAPFDAASSSTSSASGGRRRLLQSSSVVPTNKSADNGGTSSAVAGESNEQPQYTTVTTITRRAYLQMYAAVNPGGPWASVGSDILAPAVADCIMGTTPCRPKVDVTDKFAAVAYRNGPELQVDVVYHNAPQAAAKVKRCEFLKICTLSKLLVRQLEGGDVVAAPDPSADLIAGVALRQPAGTLSLRIQVGLRNPGALFLWTLSRREDETCPTVTTNLLDKKGLNPSYAPLPKLMVDASADGGLVVVSGLDDDSGNNRFGVLGG